MKPRTKLQKKIVKLSKKVDPVTNEDKQWANDALFNGYYVEVRNRNYCLECGHKWNPNEAKLSKRIIKPTCQGCGTERLEHVDDWNVDASVYEYWAIVDVVEGFQLVRMIMGKKYMKRKQPAQYSHKEVMQHWIREDGKMTSLTARTNSMGFYNFVDSWASEINLEPRTNSENHRIRCNIAPFKIRPGRNTLEIIRRNGYEGYFYKEAPHQFFSAILNHQKAETLLKAGQTQLFKLYCGLQKDEHEDIEKHWPSICIAIRNNYTIIDPRTWLDYLDLLEMFDKDTRNPLYICPDNLDREHQRYVEKAREIRQQKEREEKRQKALEENAKYVERMQAFFDLRFSAGDLEIVPLKSVEEYMIEADKLHHCLFANEYYKKENRLHLSARIDGERIETVEVDLEKLKVTQARGFQNKATEHHEKIVETVRDNMHKIGAIVSKRNITEFESAIDREVAA